MIIDAPLGDREKAQRLPGFKHTTARDFALEVFPLLSLPSYLQNQLQQAY